MRPGLAVLTFLITLAYVPGLPSNAFVGRWSVALVGAAVLLWNVRLRPGPAHVMGAVLILWAMLASAWAVSIWDHAYGLLHLLTMAYVFCAAHSYRGSFDPIWRALALGVSVSAPFAIAQALGYSPVWSVYAGGSVGLFLTKNMAADAAVLALIGAAALALSDLRRNWYLIPGPVVLGALVNSRALVLMLFAALVTAALVRCRPFARAALCLVFAYGSLVALVLFWQHVGQVQDRLAIWDLVWTNTGLWGNGLESLAVMAPAIEYAHNEFLQFAFELGAPSLLLWGVAFYALTGQRRQSHPAERAALVAVLVGSAVWFTLHTPLAAYMGALLAGYLSGCRDRRRYAEHSGGAGGGARTFNTLYGGPGGSYYSSGLRRFPVPSGSKHQVGA